MGPSCRSRLLPRVQVGHELESHPPRAIRASNPCSARLPPLNIRPDPRQAPYQILEPTVALFSPKSAAKISAESNPPLRRVLVTVSPLPIFSSLLRSRRSSRFAFSCLLHVANPHRTVQEPRRPPSSITSVPEPLLDFVLALGEFASSSSTPWCHRFAFYRPKSRKPRASAITGHGAVAAYPSSGRRSSLPHPRSNLGHSPAIQRP